MIVADVNDDAGQRVAAAVGGTYHHLDVRAPDQRRRALGQTVGGGGLDGLVNNAAVFVEGGLFDGDEAGFRRVIDVNLLGVLFGMAAVAPIMREQGRAALSTSPRFRDCGAMARSPMSAASGPCAA